MPWILSSKDPYSGSEGTRSRLSFACNPKYIESRTDTPNNTLKIFLSPPWIGESMFHHPIHPLLSIDVMYSEDSTIARYVPIESTLDTVFSSELVSVTLEELDKW